jgi:hypothetical protein
MEQLLESWWYSEKVGKRKMREDVWEDDLIKD